MKITKKILKKIIAEEIQKEMFFGKLDDIDAEDAIKATPASVVSGLHSKNKENHYELAMSALEKIEAGEIDEITDEEAFALKQYAKSME